MINRAARELKQTRINVNEAQLINQLEKQTHESRTIFVSTLRHHINLEQHTNPDAERNQTIARGKIL